MPNRTKTAVLIDGPNIYATSKALGFDIDYRKFLDHFRRCCDLMRISYYTAVADDQEYTSIRPLIDWLDYNGYRVVTKSARPYTDAQGVTRHKGYMGIEIATDAFDLAPHLSDLVLFSGDGDFRAMVEGMQRRGVRVTVASTVQATKSTVSDDLRRQADDFLDIANMKGVFGREPKDPVRAERRYDDGRPDPLEIRYGIRER